MVLSLIDLSLRSIMHGIENGSIRNPHFLPPKLRHLVLDTAIKQDLANYPNFLALLTSVEFLTGMTSISAKSCTDHDLIFLEYLVKSLAIKLPNGQTVGSTITKLNVQVHFLAFPWEFLGDWISEFFTVADLIGHCPNTTTLVLRINELRLTHEYWPLIENSACNGVMENLVDLTLSGWNEILIMNFKQLTTLKLNNCSFEADRWRLLLDKIRPTLKNLHLIDVHCRYSKGLNSILPFSLPELKSLEVTWIPHHRNKYKGNKCNKAFVDNLIGCQKLGQVHLMLDQKSTDEESLFRLASLDIDLKIKIRLFLRGNNSAEDSALFDSSSNFKAVTIFHKRVESFELYVQKEWDPQISAALEDVVYTCSNLTKFGIHANKISIQTRFPQNNYDPDYDSNESEMEVEEELNQVNADSIQFFGTFDHPLLITDLLLVGNFDEAVMSAVFENCLNLIRLTIRQCPNLRDHHLIDWVSRGGGKVTYLEIRSCQNVTSQGIIPILVKSAERLLLISIRENASGGRNWKSVARNLCPNSNVNDEDD